MLSTTSVHNIITHKITIFSDTAIETSVLCYSKTVKTITNHQHIRDNYRTSLYFNWNFKYTQFQDAYQQLPIFSCMVRTWKHIINDWPFWPFLTHLSHSYIASGAHKIEKLTQATNFNTNITSHQHQHTQNNLFCLFTPLMKYGIIFLSNSSNIEKIYTLLWLVQNLETHV
jgi:hypothetical protein